MVKNRGGENGMIFPGGENGISQLKVLLERNHLLSSNVWVVYWRLSVMFCSSTYKVGRKVGSLVSSAVTIFQIQHCEEENKTKEQKN